MRSATLVALVFLSAGALAADQPLYESDPWRSLAPHRDAACVAAGDVDLDGDLDLVFGDQQGQVWFFTNGFGRDLDRLPVLLPAGPDSPVTSLAVGDLDGDGFPEIVAGHEQDPIHVYRNEAGVFSAAPEPVGSSLEVSDLVLADLDNDRDLDLVAGVDGAANRWFPNVDGVLRPDLAVLLGGAEQTKAVAVGDLDQDGWLDLFVANAAGQQRFYYNRSGDLTADPDSLTPPEPLTPTATAMGDISSDGLMDLVFFNANGRVRAYLNNGDRTFSYVESASGVGQVTDAALADLDSDGHLDVVFTKAAASEPVAWMRFLEGAWLPRELLGDLDAVDISGGMTGLALGDFDEDGDLDVAGSAGGQAAETVVWHAGGILEAEASWPLPGTWAAGDDGTTYGLAMADLDLDGDLDVIQGRFADPVVQPNSIYLNQDGVIGPEPTWLAGTDTTTTLVVIDWDSDGYPDLLFGHKTTGGIKWHRNLNGTIDPDPTPLLPSSTPVWSLAVVDLDNDGRNDLVEGGVDEMRVSLRDQAGAGFRPTETVVLGQGGGFCNYLAFADVDGDGDRDIAIAQSNGLEMVLGNNYPTGEVPGTLWLAPTIRLGSFVLLADLDGDRQPDLTVGYAGLEVDNEWFRGSQGSFDDLGRPWGSEEYATWEAEMSDWDGDGYPDLLEAEEFGHNRLLRNRAGVIDKVGRALWTAADSTRTYRLAAGDLDQDGDLDLWVGNRKEPDQIFRGVLNPGPTNPDGPALPLKPGSPAHLRRLVATGEAPNMVTVDCQAVDFEGDDLLVLGRVRAVGTGDWLVLAPNLLTTDAAGLDQVMTYDSATWPSSPDGYVLQLRTVEIARRLGEVRHAPRYEIILEQAGISRPSLQLADRQLAIPTLTEGGTARTTFEATNTGNELLQVSGTTSRPDLILDRTDFSVDPGQSVLVGLEIAPLENIQDGMVVLGSNDPLSPVDTLTVITDIRPLAYGFNFLLEGGADRAPLGESLTGLLAPADGVDMEEGWLHFRPAGGVDFTTLPLTPLENDWVAVIPGDAVTEAGIEYYLEARNGARTVTDPASDPQASPHLLEVEPPTGMTSLVQAHSDAGILADRDIFIRVVPPPGTVLTEGSVAYREGGATDSRPSPCNPTAPR